MPTQASVCSFPSPSASHKGRHRPESPSAAASNSQIMGGGQDPRARARARLKAQKGSPRDLVTECKSHSWTPQHDSGDARGQGKDACRYLATS